jgi:membrane protease YdiL (CAAX protease family)
MGAAFLSAANQGKNNWWRYGLGILLIAFFWIFLGAIPLMIWGLYNPADILMQPTTPLAQVWQYAMISLSFVFFLVGLFITVTKIHQRRFLTLVQANGTVRIKRILQGAGVWVALMGLSYAIEAIFFPSHFVLTFSPVWFILVPIALVLTPIQSATEELFFRGYLLQGLGQFTRNRWILVGVPKLLPAIALRGLPCTILLLVSSLRLPH